MNQRSVFLIISGAALLGLATSVSAQQQMTVTANPTLTNWVESTSRYIDSTLQRLYLSGVDSGITYVRFNCDEHGRPQNISTSGPGASALARLGRQAVRRVKSLHPLFDGAKPNQTYEAAIIFANSEEELKVLRAKVNERAHRQNAGWAARGVPNPVISLAIVGGM